MCFPLRAAPGAGRPLPKETASIRLMLSQSIPFDNYFLPIGRKNALFCGGRQKAGRRCPSFCKSIHFCLYIPKECAILIHAERQPGACRCLLLFSAAGRILAVRFSLPRGPWESAGEGGCAPGGPAPRKAPAKGMGAGGGGEGRIGRAGSQIPAAVVHRRVRFHCWNRFVPRRTCRP